MKQLGLGLNTSTKKTRKTKSQDQMESVVSWSALVAIVEPGCRLANTGRVLFAVEMVLRIHYRQQWFCLSNPAMQVALRVAPLFRECAMIGQRVIRLSAPATILRLRHLPQRIDSAHDMLRLVNDMLDAKGCCFVQDRRWIPR